ncbi:hypothetical protein BKA00_007461 [Actinomadura coerulea]|uniref:Uncharacterized protein n=1 Tax=Actinomadura coerulea TaxID=46159 RepID=A0A7X0L3G4_9ACTN|nr:hypothetical protein [Actinomadura coerulea]MBB6400547.1 hypothetical protein [Actinomadura coerulea]GGQ08032.1 hypothetical protein GCM10010187_25160 [Actinomadura coerulea]
MQVNIFDITARNIVAGMTLCGEGPGMADVTVTDVIRHGFRVVVLGTYELTPGESLPFAEVYSANGNAVAAFCPPCPLLALR